MSNYPLDEPVTILLVEDNPGDVRLVKEAFRSIDTETTFDIVSDGEEAETYLRLHERAGSGPPPDLILLDLNLPRADGFRVLDVLRSELDYPPPPVLVLTSSETEEDIVESYERDANAYLRKPDAMSEFSSIAQAIEGFWIDTARLPPASSEALNGG